MRRASSSVKSTALPVAAALGPVIVMAIAPHPAPAPGGAVQRMRVLLEAAAAVESTTVKFAGSLMRSAKSCGPSELW